MMPLKSYSKEQREEVRIKLLENALHLYSLHGIKNVRLMDILKTVGISKPFFYTFFDSVQEFVINVIDYQWIKINDLVVELKKDDNRSIEEKFRSLFNKLIYYRNEGYLVMTQEEEVWVRQRISDEEYHAFMDTQVIFFEQLLEMYHVPKGKINAKAFGNMIITTILVHNSAENSLPFIYLDVLDETAELYVDCILNYLNKVKE